MQVFDAYETLKDATKREEFHRLWDVEEKRREEEEAAGRREERVRRRRGGGRGGRASRFIEILDD
jgi:DnaJ-class molecular chaperone